MAGGFLGTSSHNFTGLYNPSTGEYCKLPPVPFQYALHRHSVTGFTVCGGWSNRLNQVCHTFNTNNGKWEKSYDLSINAHSQHLGWRNSKGILLMGNPWSYKTTTQLFGN